MTHPYKELPSRAFWRTAITELHFSDYREISEKISLNSSDKVATAGSCFAQHIGRALKKGGMSYMDMEPPPAELSSEDAMRHGFGVYSCRYGNIYTVRQLLQLVEEALGSRIPAEIVWERGGRFYDAFRPSVDPVGHEDHEIILSLREKHLQKVRAMMCELDVFVFTLGLTEAWQLVSDGSIFPTCPGTQVGMFDSSKYSFVNLSYPDIYEDIVKFRDILQSVNKNARILLTVSPVPLTATASGFHVLSATSYSKSTLRAIAGDISKKYRDVAYFPSYEIIASHPMRAGLFNPDLRTVNKIGVELVMQHFFSALSDGVKNENEEFDKLGVVCDEEKLDDYAQ